MNSLLDFDQCVAKRSSKTTDLNLIKFDKRISHCQLNSSPLVSLGCMYICIYVWIIHDNFRYWGMVGLELGQKVIFDGEQGEFEDEPVWVITFGVTW